MSCGNRASFAPRRERPFAGESDTVIGGAAWRLVRRDAGSSRLAGTKATLACHGDANPGQGESRAQASWREIRRSARKRTRECVAGGTTLRWTFEEDGLCSRSGHERKRARFHGGNRWAPGPGIDEDPIRKPGRDRWRGHRLAGAEIPPTPRREGDRGGCGYAAVWNAEQSPSALRDGLGRVATSRGSARPRRREASRASVRSQAKAPTATMPGRPVEDLCHSGADLHGLVRYKAMNSRLDAAALRLR